MNSSDESIVTDMKQQVDYADSTTSKPADQNLDNNDNPRESSNIESTQKYEDLLEIGLLKDAEMARSSGSGYPQVIHSSVIDDAIKTATDLHHGTSLMSPGRQPSSIQRIVSQDSSDSEFEEDALDLAFDIAQDLSQTRQLVPLVLRSPRQNDTRIEDHASSTSSSARISTQHISTQHKSEPKSQNSSALGTNVSRIVSRLASGTSTPPSTSSVIGSKPAEPSSCASLPSLLPRKPVSWLAIRNIQWSDQFYEEMQKVLRHGIPTAKIERNRIIKTLNSKRFFEYVPFFSLLQNEIVLVDHDIPVWAMDKHGQQVAHVDLPITYTVVKRSGIHDYLKKMFSNLAENGYRSGRSLYRKVAMQAIGISHHDVETFVKNQEVAQVQSNIFSKAPGLVVQPIRSQSVMSLWECDLIDVARFASSNQQVHYLLCIIDHFSKFAWVVPLKTKESERVCYHLQLLFLQELAPESFVTDNGGEFRSQVMDELAKRWNIKVKHGLPFRSNSSGLVERFNRTIQNAIRAWMVDFSTKKYLDALPMLVYSYNVAQHSTHGYSPFLVHRGRAPRTLHLDWKSFEASSSGSGDQSSDPVARLSVIPGSEDRLVLEPQHQDVLQGLSVNSLVSDSRPPSDSPPQLVDPDMEDVGSKERESETTTAVGNLDASYTSVNSDNVKAYVDATMALNTAAQNQVAERISSKADKMITSTARRFTHKKNPRLKPGDHVRLDLLAFSERRKHEKTGFKKPLNLSNWSQQVYRVTSRIDATAATPDLYAIVDDLGNPPEANHRNGFYRYQLMLIEDKEAIDKLHDVKEKPDFNFGVLTRRTPSGSHDNNVDLSNARSSGADSEILDSLREEAADGDRASMAESPEQPATASPERPTRLVAAPRSAKGFYLSYS